MPRLFIAVRPPAEVVDRLAALERPDGGGVGWTTPDQWHITLRFLGEADENEASATLAMIEAPRCRAVLGPATMLLGNAVVAPVVGLDALAHTVRAATAGIGAPPDPRGFCGHLTLARVRRRSEAPGPVAIGAEFDVDMVGLLRSELHADGARHSTVTSRALGS